MKHHYTRRELLKAAGLLSTASLWGCGGGSSGVPGAIDNGGGPGPGPDPGITDYKALVCIFLLGGNDAYNMLVPQTQPLYDLYSAARLNLAVPKAQLIALNGTAMDGAAYGAHPQMSELAGLYNNGHAALLANVGSLLHPTTKADYTSGRVPPRLFSHNDQQDQWQTAHADASEITGWAGRAADMFSGVNGSSELPMNISIAGANTLQRGAATSAFAMAASGAQTLDGLDPGAGSLRAAFDQVRLLGQTHAYSAGYASVLDRGIRLNALLDSLLKTQPAPATAFPATPLGNQLKAVARLIGIRTQLSMKRQIFFVSMGGFDTHDAQTGDQPNLFTRLSQGLKAFYDATVELGVATSVTSFTASDFGRSLTTNGKGTDHGWSSHQWIVGGAVNGARIYGQPPSLQADGADDTQGGRFIPSSSVDQYGATLMRWMNISDSNLDLVFPNLNRFGARDLGFMT